MWSIIKGLQHSGYGMLLIILYVFIILSYISIIIFTVKFQFLYKMILGFQSICFFFFYVLPLTIVHIFICILNCIIWYCIGRVNNFITIFTFLSTDSITAYSCRCKLKFVMAIILYKVWKRINSFYVETE